MDVFNLWDRFASASGSCTIVAAGAGDVGFWIAVTAALSLAAGAGCAWIVVQWRRAARERGIERTRAERLSRSLAEARDESQRKSFFLSALSHDLRSPLNGLMLQAELAELHLEASDFEMVREALGQIKSSARATAELLDSFMEVGRQDWSDSVTVPSQVDIATLVQSLAGRFRPSALQKGLALHCRLPGTVIGTTDRVKLDRIVSNLVENAIKFTASGSVELLVEARGTDLVIDVKDTGVGIAPENRSAIFDDFFQLQNHESDSRKGFGLGLAIARRLVCQLGGELSVESTLGRGSCFRVVLPGVVTGSRAAAPPERLAGPSRSGRAASALTTGS
jgi:signal transduction histidine kinase